LPIAAEPVIMDALKNIDGQVTLLYCPVVRSQYVFQSRFDLMNKIIMNSVCIECDSCGSIAQMLIRYKGNPEYPYRVHPQLKLKAVPTIYRWQGKRGPSRSLVEGECLDEQLMEALLE
jgi:hypothetical protein